MGKTLLLVDCQYDFIDGGNLAVAGSQVMMDALADYISGLPAGYYEHIVMTADFHPWGHCSFGEWPMHCVAHTHGAAIYDAVFQAAVAHDPECVVLTKGTLKDRDEYSILQSQENGPKLLDMLEAWDSEQIDVCGICGDICVLNTLKDLLETPFGSKLHVLPEFSPSLDGGTALSQLISEHQL